MAVFRDKNHLMRQLKVSLGIYGLKLPMSDDDLFEAVILDSTLGVFSLYNADVKVIAMNMETDEAKDYVDTLKRLDNDANLTKVLKIPKYDDRDIMMIGYVIPYNVNSGIVTPYQCQALDAFQGLALAQEVANLSSAMSPPFTFDFIEPDKIRVYNLCSYTTRIVAEVHYMHHKELFTIPRTDRESFFKLALLDMKIFIYNNLRQYMTIETARAKVDLKIDEWSSAEGDKQAMLEKWDDTYHFDKNFIYYI